MTPEAASLLRKYYKQQDPILAEQIGMLEERRDWPPTVGAV